MNDALAHQPSQWIQGLAAWSPPDKRRARDLLRMARQVEGEQPGLAIELRGIAMHEAAAQARYPHKGDSMWHRAGRAASRAAAWVRALRVLWSVAPAPPDHAFFDS
jgi:hypothetical protein